MWKTVGADHTSAHMENLENQVQQNRFRLEIFKESGTASNAPIHVKLKDLVSYMVTHNIQFELLPVHANDAQKPLLEIDPIL